jgi:LPXTG-motif cell wall-anchored protein
MFLLSFALSIAIYTIFLNAKLSITISLVLFGIFLVGSGIFCLIKRKKKTE